MSGPAAQAGPALQVQVWADYCCPFCHVARERAAYLQEHHGAEVEWFPFDLHPEYPEDGLRRATLEALHGGRGFDAPVRELAAQAGLPYRPHPEVVPRTRRALELTEWARDQGGGVHRALHAAIMDACWRDGRDITRSGVLAEVADAVGLDADAGMASVDAGHWAAAVDDSTRRARQASPGCLEWCWIDACSSAAWCRTMTWTPRFGHCGMPASSRCGFSACGHGARYSGAPVDLAGPVMYQSPSSRVRMSHERCPGNCVTRHMNHRPTITSTTPHPATRA